MVNVVPYDTMRVCGVVRQGEGQEIGHKVELELFQGDKHICREVEWVREDAFAIGTMKQPFGHDCTRGNEVECLPAAFDLQTPPLAKIIGR